jgi:integrase
MVLPAWGRVAAADGVVAFEVVGEGGEPVAAISRFLRDFVARGNRPGSVRSYAYVLLRWWRFLTAVEVVWDRATPTEGRDFVLWLAQARKPSASRRTVSAGRAGRANPVTGKQYLGDQYAPRTVRHSNAVVRSFYQFWMEQGEGPLVNPIPIEPARSGGRAHAHHNPLERYRPEGRLRYNPRLPKRRPRAMPDQRWVELFTAMRSHRDRAILALAISTGARAGELVGLRRGDVDWGEQLVRVRRKGSGAEQWLPASVEAFVWLRLYAAELHAAEVPSSPADDGLWWTLRDRHDGGPARRPLTYDALRAVLRRANRVLGTNWSMHDLRHTCALRMVRDPNLSLRDVQTILGHVHLTTTQIYLHDDDDEVVRRVHAHLRAREERSAVPAPVVPAAGYSADDLALLFGADPR